MNNLPYWGIAAIKIWICTRELSYVRRRLTGDARRDEQRVWDVLTEFQIEALLENEKAQKRPLVVLKEQAIEELLAKLRSGELKAKGVKCNRFNEGDPVSDTAQVIPVEEWAYLRFRLFARNNRYAAFYEDSDFPSWRHVVCPGAIVQKLWPQDQTKAPETAQASQTIPETSPENQLSIAEPGFAKAHAATRTRSRRSHKQDAVVDALHALFPEGYYSGITASIVLDPVTNWLQENRPSVTVSEDTIRNALAKFEAQTKNTFGKFGKRVT